MDLKTLVEKHDTPEGKVFDMVIQALIIISLFTFSLETLPELSEKTRSVLRIAEAVIVILFTIEYALRIYILIIGIGIVAIPAGLLASALNKVRSDKEDDADE